MTKQKPYKLEYKFIKQLRDLLTGEDWRIAHREKITQLKESISHLPEEPALAKRAEMAADGKEFPEENFNRMVAAEAKRKEDKKLELAQIEANLSNDTYTMGIAPFERPEDAQQMLKALHILEIDSERYNQEAVVAIRNMLSENFADLYTPEIGVSALTPPEVTSTENGEVEHEERSPGKNVVAPIINKILKGESISAEDLLGPTAPPIDQLPPDTLNSINIAINGFRSIAPEELARILETLNFVAHFYTPGRFPVYPEALTLSALFHSAENLEGFFTKFVDFSTIESFEQAFPTSTMADFSLLSAEELTAWRALMIEHGPKALALFGQANSLSGVGINAASLIAESGIRQAFETIKSAALEVRFERESENPELARLCREHDLSEIIFNETLEDVIPNQKNSDDLPDISFDFSVGSQNFRFEKLQPGHLDGLFLGKMTNCCQFIDGDGGECAIAGFSRKDAGFYVIRKANGKIKAQSYAWLGVIDDTKDAIIFNSFEHLPEARRAFLPAMQQYQSILASQSELTVAIGTGGGKTPRCCGSQKYTNVRPKIDGLATYRDSSEVIEITPETIVSEGIPTIEASINSVTIDSYQDLLSKCPRLTSKSLKEKYPDEITAIKEPGVMADLNQISNIALFLTEEGILDIETIISLLRSAPNVAWNLSYYNSARQEHYKHLFLQCKEQGMTNPQEIIDLVFAPENGFLSGESSKKIMTEQAKLAQAAEFEESENANTQLASVAAEVTPPATSEQMLQAMQRCLQNFQPVEIIKLDPVEMQVEHMSTQDIIDTEIAKKCIETHQIANFNTVLNYVSEVNLQDQSGKTLLILSVIAGFTHGVKALLEKNADKTIVDSMGLNAIEYAQLHHPELVEMLTTTEPPIELSGESGELAEDFS